MVGEISSRSIKGSVTQSKIGRMLPALSSACKRNASISGAPALPSQLQTASGCNLILLGKLRSLETQCD
jgi:hypothetical protein